MDKLLSGQNIASRSESKKLALKGLISINGTVTRRSDCKVDPEKDVIVVKGQQVVYQKYLYIMMNKPDGVLSASHDRHAQTVIDLLPQELKRSGLFPAGRLDRNTTGLMLITDDGELSHQMLSPKKHVYKLYEVHTDVPLQEDIVQHFARGIVSGDDTFLPADIRLTGSNSALVEICEGKFHQIKRMFHAVGAQVVQLKRLRIGGLYLDKQLHEGEFRLLRPEEVPLLTDYAFRELHNTSF